MKTQFPAKTNYFKSILGSLPCQLLIINMDGSVIYINEAFEEEWDLSKEDILNKEITALFPNHSLSQMLTSPSGTHIMFMEGETFYLQSGIWENGQLQGAVQLGFPAATFQLTDSFLMNSYENFGNDIKAIFNSTYDVIYASNGQGITMKVSSACEELWGLTAKEMIGKSVYELEKAGVYKPSITRLVLEKKQRVQAFQFTKTAHKLMVIGTPIKNQQGEIIQVINVSRDITSEKNMQIEMDNIRLLLDAYKHELNELRFNNLKQNQFIYASEAMAKVARTALKVSDVSSIVLITGETGVGKEIVVSFIHANSQRKDKSYIKINCGAIPHSLLESELFGYEKGAFTGANRDGKLGLFELANHGTLFLDEIAEVSLDMQVKLLRVLQEGVFMRIGGTKEIKVDVRVITACNRDLEQEMQSGRFREDLYYRLNVVPIHVPPLRERSDDILPLSMFFLKRFNKQYGKSKTLAPEIIQQFQEFHWPGNIRELQNIVERLVVLTDKDLITLSDVPDYIMANHKNPGVTVNRIMPLTEAVNTVERQLIRLALKKYTTTTRAAEALGIDQSTLSRKLKSFKS